MAKVMMSTQRQQVAMEMEKAPPMVMKIDRTSSCGKKLATIYEESSWDQAGEPSCSLGSDPRSILPSCSFTKPSLEVAPNDGSAA